MNHSRFLSAANLAALCVASSAVLASCSSNIQQEDLCGIWIQPVPGSHIVQGVELKADGSARSVNMATLLYDSWKLEKESVILHGTSIGNGVSGEFSDTLGIVKLTSDSLSLQKGSLVLEYSRSVEDCGFSVNPGTVMKGRITFGPEVRKFRPENEDKEYWVIDKSGYLQERYNESGSVEWSTEAEIEVRQTDSCASEFGSEYAGTLQVLRIISCGN